MPRVRGVLLRRDPQSRPLEMASGCQPGVRGEPAAASQGHRRAGGGAALRRVLRHCRHHPEPRKTRGLHGRPRARGCQDRPGPGVLAPYPRRPYCPIVPHPPQRRERLSDVRADPRVGRPGEAFPPRGSRALHPGEGGPRRCPGRLPGERDPTAGQQNPGHRLPAPAQGHRLEPAGIHGHPAPLFPGRSLRDPQRHRGDLPGTRVRQRRAGPGASHASVRPLRASR